MASRGIRKANQDETGAERNRSLDPVRTMHGAGSMIKTRGSSWYLCILITSGWQVKAGKAELWRDDSSEPSFDRYLDRKLKAITMYKILEIENYCVDETLAVTEELARARDKRQAAVWREQETMKARRIAKQVEEYERRQQKQRNRRFKNLQKDREQTSAPKKDPKNSRLSGDQFNPFDLGEDQLNPANVGKDQSSQVNLAESQSNQFSLGEAAGRIMNGIGRELNRQGTSRAGITTAPAPKGLFTGLGNGLPMAIP